MNVIIGLIVLLQMQFTELIPMIDPAGEQDSVAAVQHADTRRRINLIISSRTKKIDPAPWSFQLQARIMRLFRRKTLFVIVAGSSEEMAVKAEKILKRERAMIGNIWFDSHGHYARRHALFEIGADEFNAVNIHDSMHVRWLQVLGAYCDENTKAGIGSCYGGATYSLPAIENIPGTRMNGDSLMMGLSGILNKAIIYGSESWVMSGPGIFWSPYALSGYPLRRKFKDKIFEPVWERLGVWNCYYGGKKIFLRVPTVSLDKRAAIHEQPSEYLSFSKRRKRQQEHLNNLKSGRLNLASLYQ